MKVDVIRKIKLTMDFDEAKKLYEQINKVEPSKENKSFISSLSKVLEDFGETIVKTEPIR